MTCQIVMAGGPLPNGLRQPVERRDRGPDSRDEESGKAGTRFGIVHPIMDPGGRW